VEVSFEFFLCVICCFDVLRVWEGRGACVLKSHFGLD